MGSNNVKDLKSKMFLNFPLKTSIKRHAEIPPIGSINRRAEIPPIGDN